MNAHTLEKTLPVAKILHDACGESIYTPYMNRISFHLVYLPALFNSRIMKTIMASKESPPPKEEYLSRLTGTERGKVELAKRYTEFPDVKDAIGVMEKTLTQQEQSENFEREMESALKNLGRATDILELSLKNQETYGLIDTRWMRDTKIVEEALQKGRLVMELDIRLDKEGEFWVSHAVGAQASMFPPFIHKMTTEEMQTKSKRYPLEDGLAAFSEYSDRGHRLILELKTLGENPEKFPKTVEKLERILKEKAVKESIAVASLSPGILMEIHKKMPEVPLILNGGIIPGISYTEKTRSLLEGILPADRKWRAFGLAPFAEIVVCASEESPRRADGQGIQTGYAFTRLPTDLLNILKEQHASGKKLGGVVSLSMISNLGHVLDALGAKERARELRAYYRNVVDELGLGKMASTWGQTLGTMPGLRHLKPEQQMRTFKKEFGESTLIYTKSPEKWAHKLPKELEEFMTVY